MTEIRAGRNRRVQVRKVRGDGWTKAKRAMFLRVLGETCNVTAAAKAAGRAVWTAQELRRRDGEFALLWDDVMEAGYERLRNDLLALALGQRSSDENPTPEEIAGVQPPPRAFDPDLAIKVLRLHGERGLVRGGKAAQRPRKTQGEIDAAVLARLDALAARRPVSVAVGPDALAALRDLPLEARRQAYFDLPPDVRAVLYDDWTVWAHAGQLPPPGDWRVWVIRAGRGFGKTRAGAEWVSDVARATPDARIALVGATEDEVRRVMIEGDAGLLAVARNDEPIRWRKAAGEVLFASGAVGYLYSAAAPEKLRGPSHHAAWCDELAKWRYGDAAWDNLVMGLRLGAAPRIVVTTTPRPVVLMRRVLAGRDVVETRGRTCDNPHLPAAAVQALDDLYGGSRIGRQELDGELIDDVEGALWTRAMIEACARGAETAPPELVRVVVAVDPPAGTASGKGGDACGIMCAALGADGLGYVIEDASVAGKSPEGWARAVAECAARHGADRVVAESNQGGDMVRAVLEAADAVLPLTLVHATRGKVARAEPVAALYERGKVIHLGRFRALEDQLCGLVSGGAYHGPGRSPDRADALVWALSELMLGAKGAPAVRQL